MKEQCRIAERFFLKSLQCPTEIIIQPVTSIMARATVDMPFSLLFVQNYLQNMEKKSIIVL